LDIQIKEPETTSLILTILKTTGPETQRDFGGDVWKFVEKADSLAINDIDSPAKRPSVQDALKELDGLEVR
jgi:hypothetical protein